MSTVPEPPYDGGCLCGAVRYRVTTKPLTLYACHCTDCQRQTGSSFVLSMIVLADAVELLRGQPATFSTTTADGIPKQSRFCGDCGSRLWGEPPKYPEIKVVRPGSLDATSWIVPVGHIWTRSAQPWITYAEDAVCSPTQPEDPMAMIHAWRERHGA